MRDIRLCSPGCQPLLATIANGKMLVAQPEAQAAPRPPQALHRRGLSVRRITTKVTTEGYHSCSDAPVSKSTVARLLRG